MFSHITPNKRELMFDASFRNTSNVNNNTIYDAVDKISRYGFSDLVDNAKDLLKLEKDFPVNRNCLLNAKFLSTVIECSIGEHDLSEIRDYGIMLLKTLIFYFYSDIEKIVIHTHEIHLRLFKNLYRIDIAYNKEKILSLLVQLMLSSDKVLISLINAGILNYLTMEEKWKSKDSHIYITKIKALQNITSIQAFWKPEVHCRIPADTDENIKKMAKYFILRTHDISNISLVCMCYSILASYLHFPVQDLSEYAGVFGKCVDILLKLIEEGSITSSNVEYCLLDFITNMIYQDSSIVDILNKRMLYNALFCTLARIDYSKCLLIPKIINVFINTLDTEEGVRIVLDLEILKNDIVNTMLKYNNKIVYKSIITLLAKFSIKVDHSTLISALSVNEDFVENITNAILFDDRVVFEYSLVFIFNMLRGLSLVRHDFYSEVSSIIKEYLAQCLEIPLGNEYYNLVTSILDYDEQ